MWGEPRIVIHAANRDIDKAGTRRVLAIQTTAARRAEVSSVDVAAFGSRGIAGRRSRDRYVLALEAGQRHMAGAGRSLAVFAVALPHADRFRMDRETYGAAKAAPRRKWLLRHARPRASLAALESTGLGFRSLQSSPYGRTAASGLARPRPEHAFSLDPRRRAGLPTQVSGSARSFRPHGCASAR